MNARRSWLLLALLGLLACRALAPAGSQTAIPVASALPDLALVSASLTMPDMHGNCVSAYAPYQVEVVVENRGAAPSPSAILMEEISGQTIEVEPLAAGQRMAVQFPATAPGGAYRFSIDPQKRVTQGNETDKSLTFLAPTPTPPLLCTPAGGSLPAVTPATPDLSTPIGTLPPPGIPAAPSVSTQAPILPPLALPEGAMIAWQSLDQPCRSAAFWADHLTYGLCGAPPASAPATMLDYTSRFQIWSRAYAPFTAQAAVGQVTFNGGGHVIATPAEQRMIIEWARRMSNDGPAGRSAAGDGPVVWGHLAGEGACFDFGVYRDGRYLLSSCTPGFSYPAPDGYLDANELLYLYRWMDRLEPYDETSGAGTLSFAGGGTQPASLAEKISIETLATNLDSRARAAASGGGLPAGALAAQRLLAMQLNLPPEQVQVASVEPTDFPDGCFGLPAPNEACPPGPVSGLKMKLVAGGLLYEFHSDLAGYDLRPAGEPVAAPPGG